MCYVSDPIIGNFEFEQEFFKKKDIVGQIHLQIKTRFPHNILGNKIKIFHL